MGGDTWLIETHLRPQSDLSCYSQPPSHQIFSPELLRSFRKFRLKLESESVSLKVLPLTPHLWKLFSGADTGIWRVICYFYHVFAENQSEIVSQMSALVLVGLVLNNITSTVYPFIVETTCKDGYVSCFACFTLAQERASSFSSILKSQSTFLFPGSSPLPFADPANSITLLASARIQGTRSNSGCPQFPLPGP